MFQVWRITAGTAQLISSHRMHSDAEQSAVEQSLLDDSTPFAVMREGFGEPLYYVWRGMTGAAWDIMRRMSIPDPVPSPIPAPVAASYDDESEDLGDLSVSALRAIARDLDIPGRSGLSREDLIAAIRAAEGTPGPTEFKAKSRAENEYKTSPAFVIETKQSEDGKQGLVKAIVNVYGIIDEGYDMTHPGMFARSLSENGGRVRVLNAHNQSGVLSAVGKPRSMREIGRDELPQEVLQRYPESTGGLLTESEFMLTDPTSKAVYDRLDAGWIDEWSIGFQTLQYDTSRVKRVNLGDHFEYQVWLDGDDERGFQMVRDDAGNPVVVRHLRQARLWEYSPVLWGMNPATATTSVKDRGESDTEETDTEEYTADPVEIEAPEPAEEKAGRVLSQRNYDAIKQAYELLAQVMGSAGLNDSGEDEEMSAPNSDSTKATDGPSVSTDAPTSTPEAGPQDDVSPAAKQAALLNELNRRLVEVEELQNDL